MTFPREDQGWGETAFSGGATVDIPNLRDLSALFPMPPLSGSVRGEISGTGTFARPEGRASLTGRRIEVAGKKLGDVDLRARRHRGGDRGRHASSCVQGGNRFTAQGVRFSPAALAAPDRSAFFDSLAGSFTLSATDLPGLAALAGIPPEQAARIPAAHLLTAAGTVQDRAIDVTAAILRRRGRLDHPARCSCRAARPRGGLEEGHDIRRATWRWTSPTSGRSRRSFTCPPLQGTLTGKARISGSAAAPGGSVEASGRGIAIGGRRVGDVVLKAAARRQRLMIETLEVNRGEDRLRGRGAYDLEKGTLLEAEADLSVADVAPYLAEFVREGIPVSGRLHAGLRAAGPLPGAPLAIEAEFSEGGRAQGCGVQAQIASGPAAVRIGAAPWADAAKPRPPPGHARRDLRARPAAHRRVRDHRLRGPRGEGRGDGAAGFRRGRHPEPRPHLDPGAGEHPRPGGTGLPGPPGVGPHGFPARRCRRHRILEGARRPPRDPRGAAAASRRDPLRAAGPLHARGNPDVEQDRGASREGPARVAVALPVAVGRLVFPPALPSLLAGTGDAKTGSLSLRASFSSPDIGWLQKSVEGLRGLRGSVAGEIAVDGPAGDPVVSGEIRIAEGAVRYQDLPPLESLTAKASVARSDPDPGNGQRHRRRLAVHACRVRGFLPPGRPDPEPAAPGQGRPALPRRGSAGQGGQRPDPERAGERSRCSPARWPSPTASIRRPSPS